MTEEATYYSLLVQWEKNSTWSIEYGSYDREEVEQEKYDLQYSLQSRKRVKIITTGDSQASIDSAVSKLNEGIA